MTIFGVSTNIMDITVVMTIVSMAIASVAMLVGGHIGERRVDNELENEDLWCEEAL